MGFSEYSQQYVRMWPKPISALSRTPFFLTVADNNDRSNNCLEYLREFACPYRLLQSDWKNNKGIIL